MTKRRSLKSPTTRRFEQLIRSLPEVARAYFLHRESLRRIRTYSKHRQLPQLRSQDKYPLVEICRGYRDLRWHQIYASVNEVLSPNYVPEDIFHCVIESHLNPFRITTKYSDKNQYDIYFPGHMPRTVARVIRGRLLDSVYRPLSNMPPVSPEKLYVIKPTSETGMGLDVTFVPGAQLATTLSTHISQQSRDLIVQEAIEQHEELASFNPDSTNTLRIMTMRTRTGVDVVSTVFRCGRPGSRVDNHAAGGLACGVNKDGRLKEFAIDKMLNRHATHPDTGATFAGFTIPHFPKAVELVTQLHFKLPDVDLVSWDVAIDSAGSPILIETNIRTQEIGFHQFCNGPVFEPYVEYLSTRCKGFTFLGVPMKPYWEPAAWYDESV